MYADQENQKSTTFVLSKLEYINQINRNTKILE